ncbi:MAG: hypothetical protein J6U26_04225 [Lachnospiraceae bacterium]|nr:hypothetical protein [Lachnospiraceae bacterium]
MGRRIGLHFIITGVQVLLCTLLLLIPDPAGRVIAMFAPGLFFAVLTGVLSGPVFAAFTGILPTLFCYFLLGRPPLLPDAAAEMLCLASSGILAGVFTGMYRAPGAGAVLGVLGGRIVLGAAMLVYDFVTRDSYTLLRYLEDAYLSCWPGIVLAVIGTPAVYLGLRRAGLVKRLQSDR